MTPSLQIALLEPDELTRTQLALALVRAGLSVVECADIAALYEVLDVRASLATARSGPIVVVYLRQAAYSPALLAGLLPHVRRTYRVAVVMGIKNDASQTEAGPPLGT